MSAHAGAETDTEKVVEMPERQPLQQRCYPALSEAWSVLGAAHLNWACGRLCAALGSSYRGSWRPALVSLGS